MLNNSPEMGRWEPGEYEGEHAVDGIQEPEQRIKVGWQLNVGDGGEGYEAAPPGDAGHQHQEHQPDALLRHHLGSTLFPSFGGVEVENNDHAKE